ncbi:MAG: cytochrome c [Deltaproteobacteria bacterium]|nr:cytochrome c [Deltaproteobacteria bacterium]
MVMLFVLLVIGCEKDSSEATKTAGPGDAKRGRRIYISNCAACHNIDPSREGSVGPAIKGSSRELVEARIMSSGYPPGYKPKRKSATMPAYPYLKSAVPDIAAFLVTNP